MSTDEPGIITPSPASDDSSEHPEISDTSTDAVILSPGPDETELDTGSPPDLTDETEAETDSSGPEEHPEASDAETEIEDDTGDHTPPPPDEKKSPEGDDEKGIEADSIEEVNVAKGDIYKIYYDAESGKKKSETTDDTFNDPTQYLPDNPAKFQAFHDPKDLVCFLAKWMEDRLLLLGGLSEDILLSTAYQLIEQTYGFSYEKRYLNFNDYNSDRTELILEMFRKYDVGPGEEMIVLIDIEEKGTFYDSIFGSRAAAQSIKEYLTEKNILLIAIVQDQLMKEVERKAGKSFHFAYWKIDFLPHLLANVFPNDAEELAHQITEQKNKKLWGDKKDDNEFYIDILFELNKGAKSFIDKVEKLQEIADGKAKPAKFSENLWETRAEEVFNNTEPHKTVLFAGAYFSKLPPLDFDLMVSLLLSGKTAPASKTTKVTSYSGDDKTVETEEQKDAAEIWEENADSILTQCKLKAVSEENSAQHIGFVQPYLESDLKNYFKEKHPIYMRQQFRPIQKSGILFREDISPNISSNIVRLAGQMAILNPTYYGANWLMDFIHQLRAKFNISETASHNPVVQVINHIENETNEMIRRHFYAQVSKLTREMLNHEQLKVVVKNFLNELFKINAHDAVLHIAINVGKRMFPSHRSDFDLFYWFKRLLDQGPSNIKIEAYQALHRVAVKNPHDIYLVMDSILDWAPDPDKDEDHFSPSNKFALYFFNLYCLGTLGGVKEEHYGQWPSQYPLFRPLHKDKSHMAQLEKIIDCLMHPFIRDISKKSGPGKKEEFDLYAYLAKILEDWGVILMGWEFETKVPDAEELFHTLTGLILSKTKSFQHTRILKQLVLKRAEYKKEFTRVAEKKPKNKKKLITNYKMISRLIDLLKKLISEHEGRKSK